MPQRAQTSLPMWLGAAVCAVSHLDLNTDQNGLLQGGSLLRQLHKNMQSLKISPFMPRGPTPEDLYMSPHRWLLPSASLQFGSPCYLN